MPRSPARSSSLKAEFNAAEQKRQSRQFEIPRSALALTQAYVDLEINIKSVKLIPFEKFVLRITSRSTIKIVRALLDWLESEITLKQAATGTGKLSSLENIDHLLKRIETPTQSHKTANATINSGERKVWSRKESAQSQIKLPRYSVRVFLCAYMILEHPDEVFREKGENEIALAKSTDNFIREFELLIKIILDGPIQTPQEESVSSVPTQLTFRSQLNAFDKAWCSYLYHFVTWKVNDAKLLEEDLVRAACQMELSIMRAGIRTAEGDYGDLTPDIKVIQNQVIKDQELLKEKVQHLSGDAGLERMECALSDIRSRFLEAKEAAASPLTRMSFPSSLSSSNHSDGNDSRERNNLAEAHIGSSDDFSSGNKVNSTSPRSKTAGHLSSRAELVTRNEMLVNEIVHEHGDILAHGLDFSKDDQDSIKFKVRETMEKAFWDGIMDSMKQDEPDFNWVLKLMKEVQDKLCEMSPSSWREEIVETIDIDVLSQVLKSGTSDMDYLGRILEFAMTTLQKLCAPDKEDEIKTSYHKLLKELGEISDKANASFALLMIMGLRFVLQEIQTLEHEIKKARIKIIEPLIKGDAGLEYLTKAFTNRYGSPSDAPTSLPLTVRWLSALSVDSVQEWDDYIDSLSALQSNVGSSMVITPTTLRTGGSIQMASTVGDPTYIANAKGTEQPECKGEKIDLLLRIGLLKLVSKVEGLTLETLPETLELNLSRLRSVQSQLQKIIVICTSILILRQVLHSENLATSQIEMENIVSECTARMFNLLNSVETAGMPEIVETMGSFIEKCDPEKLQTSKEAMSNMLSKSLRDGDAIFTRVTSTIYKAASKIVLGGSGEKGRQLGERELKRVGAAALIEKLAEAMETVVVVATVSGKVHGEWYEHVLKNM